MQEERISGIEVSFVRRVAAGGRRRDRGVVSFLCLS